MSIIRVKKVERYSIISNTVLNDTRLSWKATAILVYLLSKPDDWTIHVKQLAKAKKCGLKSVYSGIKELKETGYMEHTSTRDEKAHIIKWEYVVHEEPYKIPEIQEEKLLTPKGEVGKVEIANRHALVNTDLLPKTKKNERLQKPPPDFTKSAIGTLEPEPPSPFSATQLTTLIASLFSLVPEQFQQPALRTIFRTALKAHSELYVKQSIAYTIANSTGNTRAKFKAYLDKCIKENWIEGSEPEAPQAPATRQPDHGASIQADREEREREGMATREEINALSETQLAALDDFIGRQNLNKTMRERFKVGNRGLLRINYFHAFKNLAFF